MRLKITWLMSAIGPELTSRDVRDVVAIGRKADLTRTIVSDIDTVMVGSLKALDPNRPIREADIDVPDKETERRFVVSEASVRPGDSIR